MGLQPDRPYVKSANIVGERDGRVPPPRRRRDLRHARAPGAGLRLALPAGRRPGQLRLERVPAAAMRYTEARLSRIATEMLRDIDEDTVDDVADLRRPPHRAHRAAGALPEPPRQRLRRASPSAWRRTSRRTTSARSIDAVVALIDDPGHRGRGPDAPRQGAGLPDRRHHRRPRRRGRRLPHRPRPGGRARPRPQRAAQARHATRSSSPSCRTRSTRPSSSARSPTSRTTRSSRRSPTCATRAAATGCAW